MCGWGLRSSDNSRLVREDDDGDGGIMDSAMSFGEAARRTNSIQVRAAIHDVVARDIQQP